MAKYDVIIIGAGPNGVTAGAYLSKLGLKVLVIERKLEAGGGLATEEVTLPGYLHNTHAIYHMMVDYAPVYKDFKLEEEYNVKHILPSLVFAMPLSDGRFLGLYTDVDKSCESIAKFSTRDAEAYREVYHKFQKYMDEFLAPATYVRPLSALEQATKLEQSDLGREISAFSEKSPKKIVDELFENDHVRTMMLYLACHWGLEYNVDGLGYLVPLYIDRSTHYSLCVNGSHTVFQAIHKALIENGGMTWGSQMIKRIIVEDGTAKGVQMEDGTIVEADKAVLSTIDPHQTFLKLVGKDNLSEYFVNRLEDWKYDKWSLFVVHLAMDQAPVFANPEIADALIYIVGYESCEDLINHWEAIYRGELPEHAGFNCCFPSIHDPSQAPPDRYTGLISQMAPYHLNGKAETWYGYKLKQEYAENCLTTLDKHWPGVKDKVLWKAVTTPLDIHNKFQDMVEGGIKQGAYLPLQMGYLRPNEECSQNRTPIKKLYLGGASCHPGGLCLHGCGYIAANTIAEDLGIEKWWSEPDFVTRAREKGLL